MVDSSEQYVRPILKNFIKSLRDIGYSFEIAVADIIDNSISANSSEVDILAIQNNSKSLFHLLDNGSGMTNDELVEAMRIATNDPDDLREKNDLGKFGLGLKTASFSQCKVLTVISKKNNQISIKQWDLQYLAKINDWILKTPNISDYKDLVLFKKLENQKSGTLVIWEKIDRFDASAYTHIITKLRQHLSLVFHRFLSAKFDNKLKITINNNQLEPFDPFNSDHKATLEKSPEKIQFDNHTILVKPFILPHHSKIDQRDWDFYATSDGYIKSQGFYLYRANRLIIFGTWWGLHKSSDAHKLVRIQIDISNTQDKYWGIDVKKSNANPIPEIKKELKNIINNVTKQGAKPFSERGRRKIDKSIARFWDRVVMPDKEYFRVNLSHPLINTLFEKLNEDQIFLFKSIIKGIETYLPINSIQALLQTNPHSFKQESVFSDKEKKQLIIKLKELGIPEDEIQKILKSEISK